LECPETYFLLESSCTLANKGDEGTVSSRNDCTSECAQICCADFPSLRPVVKLQPSDVHKVSGIARYQDPLMLEDNRSDAKIIRTDTTMMNA
jgi:hypothetical protein